jgi:hypothetical protein
MPRIPDDVSPEPRPCGNRGESMRDDVRVRAVCVLVATTLASCGGGAGRVSSEGDASDDALPTNGGAAEDALSTSGSSSSGGGSGSSPGSEPLDAGSFSPPTLSPGPFKASSDSAPPGCTPVLVGGTGGLGGVGSCTISFGEMCGSTSYHVTCACPQGTCACIGTTTSVVDFAGCPNCPGDPNTVAGPGSSTIAQVFALCGFPK